MTRIRTDNVFGTTTDNPLTAGATTMNSAGLANLAAVSSTEAIIILDPNRVAGAPEIVVVTAHTGSATSATIQRGQFGTTAREHASGTEWVHGPIASNASTFVTGSDDQGDFVPMNAWESYTPSNTNVTLGNGTQVARFVRIGRTIHFRYTLTWGSTTAFGGTVDIGLPVAMDDEGYVSGYIYGTVGMRDSSSSTIAYGNIRFQSTTLARPISLGNDGVQAFVNGTTPWTWATGDVLTLEGTYEAAS